MDTNNEITKPQHVDLDQLTSREHYLLFIIDNNCFDSQVICHHSQEWTNEYGDCAFKDGFYGMGELGAYRSTPDPFEIFTAQLKEISPGRYQIDPEGHITFSITLQHDYLALNTDGNYVQKIHIDNFDTVALLYPVGSAVCDEDTEEKTLDHPTDEAMKRINEGYPVMWEFVGDTAWFDTNDPSFKNFKEWYSKLR